MDKTKIIDKYKKQKKHEQRGKLRDGGEIIGLEVDENNFLHYVIKRGNQLSIEEAQHSQIAEMVPIILVRTEIQSQS